MKDSVRKQIEAALWAVLAVGASALLSYVFTDTSSKWYLSLAMPAFMPPPMVFTIAWAVLYPLLAFTLYRQIVRQNNCALWGFAVILTLLALWNYAFFTLHNSLAALILLALAVAATIYTIRHTWTSDKLSSVALLLFLGWIVFAGVLNFYIYMMN